jgi:hypothetical protein
VAENLDGVLTPGSSGITSNFGEYSDSLLGYLREAMQEGVRINRADPAFQKADDVIAYIQGAQPCTPGGKRVDYLPNVILNQMKKAVSAHVSALTDVRPLFAWKSANPRFADHAQVLNQYGTIWWVNTQADMLMADAIKYSLACGAGDVILEWDQHYQGGESRLIARDPRDTLPFRPERTGTIQDWEGVTYRQVHTINKLRRLYPDKTYAIKPDSGIFPAAATRYYRASSSDYTPPTTLDGLTGGNPLRRRERYMDLGGTYPEATLYITHLKDNQLNLTGKARLMGRSGTNWSYLVPPGRPLYPRGRMIVWTEHGILYDGPNPYWHELYNVSRLRLQTWPWLFGGMGLMNDLRPAQDILNYLVNDLLSLLSQYVNRGAVFDKAVPENVKRRWDARRPNWKLTRPNNFSDGIKLADVPQLPPWAFQLLGLMFTKFDELAGTANLQALLQLRQMPGRDTIEKYIEALTPEIRMEARQVELFIRDLSVMLKSNLFQFVSRERRYALLGDAGTVIEDLDYDPDTMIPAMQEGDAGYHADLDFRKSRDERARYYQSQFVFYAAPYSLLNITAQERKLLYLQLARQGYIDVWTLSEVLEIPNMGTPPPMELPPLDWEPSAESPGPPKLEWRIPRTIPERLRAQQQLGIGQTVSPAGRKASGQQAPQLKSKGDGRPVVSESG